MDTSPPIYQDEQFYFYRCTPQRVIDGDTVVLDIDLGMNISITEPCRLSGIDAPELRGFTRYEGLESKAFLTHLIDGDHKFACQTYKDRTGKYGRYIVTLYMDDECINDIMIERGYAKPYVQ